MGMERQKAYENNPCGGEMVEMLVVFFASCRFLFPPEQVQELLGFWLSQ